MALPAARPPRVVLVEDDASLRRFVQLALEELDLELVQCRSVAEGLQALQAGPAGLVLTDLMLGGQSGLQLVERLAGDPVLRGPARVAVCSAGLTPEVRQRLLALGVWRILPKPVGLAELERCAEEALAAGGPGRAQAAPPQAGDEADVIARHFNGDTRLYQAFRASCLTQFALDERAGAQACAAGDAPALCRLAHSLKTVLASLGHPAPAALAAQVEQHAAQGRLAPAAEAWARLSPWLRELART